MFGLRFVSLAVVTYISFGTARAAPTVTPHYGGVVAIRPDATSGASVGDVSLSVLPSEIHC